VSDELLPCVDVEENTDDIATPADPQAVKSL
jgi:hypothetical protein